MIRFLIILTLFIRRPAPQPPTTQDEKPCMVVTTTTFLRWDSNTQAAVIGTVPNGATGTIRKRLDDWSIIYTAGTDIVGRAANMTGYIQNESMEVIPCQSENTKDFISRSHKKN